MVMVTGAGPQLNVMMPPAATAGTTAADVQLSGVPRPISRSGWEVSSASASNGTGASPFGLPGLGRVRAWAFLAGVRDGAALGGLADGEPDGGAIDGATTAGGADAGGESSSDPHAATALTRVNAAAAART